MNNAPTPFTTSQKPRGGALALFGALFLGLSILAGCGGGGGGNTEVPISSAPVAAAPESAPAAPAAQPSAGCRVVLYGDSIMAREWVAPRMLAQRPGWTVANRAMPGDTAIQGVPRVIDEPREFDAAALEWGVNDITILNAYPQDAIARMVDKLHAERIAVVVTGIVNVRPVASILNDVLRKMAAEHGAMFGEWGSVAVVTTDGTHPDQASTDRIVDKLVQSLDAACPKP